MNTILIIAVVAIMASIFLFMPMEVKAQKKVEIRKYFEYIEPINYIDSAWLDMYGKGDEHDAEQVHKQIAPLTKERYIRRIKMLFGIDVTNHFDNKGHFYWNELIAVFPETQLMKIRQYKVSSNRWFGDIQYAEETLKKDYQIAVKPMYYDKDKNVYIYEDYTDSTFFWASYFPDDSEKARILTFNDMIQYYKWIYYSDSDALKAIKQEDDKFAGEIDPMGGDDHGQYRRTAVKQWLAAPYDLRDGTDASIPEVLQRPTLYSAMYSDVKFIKALNKIGRSREFNNVDETKSYDLDFDIMPMVLQDYNFNDTIYLVSCPIEKEYHFRIVDAEPKRYIGCNNRLVFILRSLNTYLRVPRYVSLMGGSVSDFLKEHEKEFKEYNYFGYTLLRDYATDGPFDNSKIGVPHTAKAINSAALLVDPFDNSVEFDQLQNNELFTVYEMGYDDFYFVQCAKPIEEWNKRDAKGFAMCTGRYERVWGYVRKNKVNIEPDSKVTPFINYGIVSDADGNTNLRNFEKKIIGKVKSGTWVKIISYDINSYYVELADGAKGYIHKSRIVW